MSEEAHWEVEGLQRYVAALAEHDLVQSTPLYLGAALGVPFTENDTDISSLSLGNLLDISSFWGSAQAHVHHRMPQQPLHWNTLAALGSLDFTIGSDLGVRMSSSHLTANESRAIPPTLHLMSRLSGGMPEKPVRQEPAAGWCVTRHRPKKPAQSGYRGTDGLPYCKPCFRQKFPRLFELKNEARKHNCCFCGSLKDLVGGYCKPCRRVRGCEECGEVNANQTAEGCRKCGGDRLALWCAACHGEAALRSGLCGGCRRDVRGCERCGEVNANQTAEGCRHCGDDRLAMWCTTCYDEAALLSCLCAPCYSKKCMYCARVCGSDCVSHRCGSCRATFDLCADCCPLLVCEHKPVCMECWLGSSRQCIVCASRDARMNKRFFRCCWQCHTAL